MKEIERPDVERAAGEVHACRCFGFDDHGYELTRFRGFQSSQFDGFGQPSQAMTAVGVYGKATTLTPGNRLVLGKRKSQPPLAARLRAMSWGPSFFSCARAGLGSKQRRQRASYAPMAPTTISSSLSTRRWVWTAGLPQRTQMARSLVISSATARRRGIGSNGRPR